MNLLVVESDPNLARVMGDVFTADGHTVLAATDGRGALSAVATTHPDVLLVCAELADGRGVDVVRALRRRDEAGETTVIVIAERVDEALRSACSDLSVSHILPKPVSLLDLSELIRSAARRGGTRAVARPLHAENAATLANLWARRATGVLRVEQPGLSAWVLFAAGGPVGADGLRAIRAALDGGRVELEPCPVEGPGDRDGLALLLWSSVQEWMRGEPLAPPRSREVALTPISAEAAHLPVRSVIRGILRAISSPMPLDRLLDAVRGDPREVHGDLASLAVLGFLTLRPSGVSAPRNGAAASHSVDRFADTRDIVLPPDPPRTVDIVDPERSDTSSRTRSPGNGAPSSGASDAWARSTRTPPPRSTPSAAASTPPTSVPSASRPVSSASRSDTSGPRSDVSGSRSVPSVPPAPRSTASGSTPGAPRGSIQGVPSLVRRTLDEAEPTHASGRPPAPRPAAPPDPRTGAVEAAQQLLRLRREARVVRTADPWTVLGIPRDSSLEFVERAGARMTDRYAALTAAVHPEVRSLAGEIAARIEASLDTVREKLRVVERPETPHMREGFRAIEQGDWLGAEQAFDLAREVAPDSPEAIAHLGWARLHNPQLPRDEREEEGFALLDLAVQFDPGYAAGWWFLAAGSYEAGREAEAQAHLGRVLKLAPNHAEANALLRKLTN